MRCRIGADALEADEIVVTEVLGLSLALIVDRAVVAQATGRRDQCRRAKAELGMLAQALLTVIEQRVGARKGARTRLGDEGGGHAAGRRPAGIDGQHGLHEILVEGRASQYAAAASLDQGRVFAEYTHRRCRLPVGGEPAAYAFSDLGQFPRGEPLPAQNHRLGTALSNLDRPQPIADPFAPPEPTGLGIPAPWRQMGPAMAGNRQPKV